MVIIKASQVYMVIIKASQVYLVIIKASQVYMVIILMSGHDLTGSWLCVGSFRDTEISWTGEQKR